MMEFNWLSRLADKGNLTIYFYITILLDTNTIILITMIFASSVIMKYITIIIIIYIQFTLMHCKNTLVMLLYCLST